MRQLRPLLILSAAILGLFSPLPRSADGGDEALVEIATWNLEWFNSRSRGFPENTRGGPSYGPRDAEGLQAIAAIIRHDIAVLGLQEIQSAEDLTQLTALLPGYHMYVLEDNATQHCALLWNSNRVSARIRPPLRQLAVTPRMRKGLHASLRAGQFDFNMLVVHLAADRSRSAQQTRIIWSWIHGGLMPETRPYDEDLIIAGDFNLTPDEPPLRILLDSPLLTWIWEGFDETPATRPFGRGGQGSTIDHIIMSRPCAENWRVGIPNVPMDGYDLETYRRLLSDHLPVIQSFRTVPAERFVPAGQG